MSYFCPSRIKLACIAAATFFVSGCLEQSTVIKVRSDGSGIVHLRNHEQNAEITIGGKTQALDSETKIPSAELIQEMIASMGDGVSLTSATATTNRNGWQGYELVFDFDDINQLVISDELTSPSDDDAEDTSESDADVPAEADESEQGYRFSMKDGELMIHSLEKDQAVAETEQAKPVGAVDPFAEEAASPPVGEVIAEQMIQVYAKLFKDMRVGVFVEIEGEIESTNALHRKENLITLLRADFGKLLEGPDATERLKKLTKLKQLKNSPNRRQQMQLISDELEGFEIDTQDPIVVQLR